MDKSIVLPNVHWITVNTTAGDDSVTLATVIGKTYGVQNQGTGGNILTVTYGTNTKILNDRGSFRVLYDGDAWVVVADSKSRYTGDPIATDDILIPVNGIVDSQGHRAIQKKISWNPYETWKTDSITGDLRFPRGEAGVFEEYENLLDPDISAWTHTLATVTKVGNWFNVTATGGAASRSSIASLPGATSFSIYQEVKKNTANNIRIYFTDGTTDFTVDYIFSTGTITPSAGLTVTKKTIGIEEFIFEISIPTTLNALSNYILYPDRDGESLSTYFKDPQAIGGIDYPVPYVKGIHTADSWVVPVNWNESTDWTIDMWFKPEITVGAVIDTRNSDGEYGFLLYYTSNNLYLQTKITGATTTILSIQPIIGQSSHIRIVFEENVRCRVYVNSVLAVTNSANIALVADISPLIHIGLFEDGANQLNGYISDIMIRPSADTSTTHYDLGLPWTNPENPINTEHGAYQDKFGNIVGETITANEEDAYSVVEQYTIGDQTVTKWSNGDMEIIHGSNEGAVAITSAWGSNFISITLTPSLYLEDFSATELSEIITVASIADNAGVTTWLGELDKELTRPPSFSAIRSTASTTNNLIYNCISKGTWK